MKTEIDMSTKVNFTHNVTTATCKVEVVLRDDEHRKVAAFVKSHSSCVNQLIVALRREGDEFLVAVRDPLTGSEIAMPIYCAEDIAALTMFRLSSALAGGLFGISFEFIIVVASSQ